MADEADIVLVDWGTSSLRVWTLDRWGAIVGQRRSDRGMGRLSPADFGSELQANLTALDVDGDVPVLICGMAGAAQGWQEAQYIDIPSDLAALAGAAVPVAGQQRDIRILPGMAQRDIACPNRSGPARSANSPVNAFAGAAKASVTASTKSESDHSPSATV